MIQLQSLSVDNFRGIGHGEIEGLTGVNVLVGRNNSGKTTVIEAIQRLCVTVEGLGVQSDFLGRNVESFWQTVRTPAVTAGLMWFRQDSTKTIGITGMITETTDPGSAQTFTLSEPRKSPHQREQTVPTRPTIEAHRAKAFLSAVTVIRPQDAFNQQIEQRLWPDLLSKRRDKTLTATLNEVFGLQAESFQLLPNYQLTVLFEEYSLPLDAQGDGTRAALRTLMVLAMMQRTLLMLEEPESHQHPGSLERFSTAICKLAKSQEVQLIVSTHSEECVRSFLKGAGAAGSDAAVFHLSLHDGRQQARRLDPTAVETLMSTGVDVRLLDLYA